VKKVVSGMLCGVFLLLSMDGYAQLGGLGALKGGSKTESKNESGGNAAERADKFVADATVIREAVVYSLIQINAALGDKNQIAIARKQAESLAAETKPKELAAKQGTAIKDLSAEADRILKNAETEQKIKSLSPEMQKRVAQSLLAVGIAALKLPDTLEAGQALVSELSGNMMANMSRLGPLKDGLKTLGETAPKLPPLVSTGFKLMQSAKVDAGSPTKDAELKPNKEIVFPEE